MKKIISMMIAVLMVLSLAACGSDSPAPSNSNTVPDNTNNSAQEPVNNIEETNKTEITITEENFKEYFEYVQFSYWELDSFNEPDPESLHINSGWALKKEYADAFIEYKKDDRPIVRMKCDGGKIYYKVSFDENDWTKYTVLGYADKEHESFTFDIAMQGFKNPSTGETRWGFFYSTTSSSGPGDVKRLILNEDEFIIEKMKGTFVIEK